MRFTDLVPKAFWRKVREAGIDGYMVIVGMIIVTTAVILAIFAEFIAPYDPIARVGPPVSPPSPEFLLGTDSIGRDVLSRLIYGARTIMIVILISTILSMYLLT